MAIADTTDIIANWPLEGCTLAEAHQRMPSFAQGVRPDGVTAAMARLGLPLNPAYQTLKSFCERELRPYLESGDLVLVDGQSEEAIRKSLIRYLQFDPDSGIVRGPDPATVRYAVRVYKAGVWEPKPKESLLVKHDGPIQIADQRRHKRKKTVTPVGAPAKYDNLAIVAAARDVIKRGVPDSQALFFEKVRDECDEHRIRYHKSASGFADVVGPIYKKINKHRHYR